MVFFIIVLVIIGLIAGLIARLLVPGPDPIGLLGTIVLGVVGSFVGGFVENLIEYRSVAVNSFHTTGIIGSVIGAVILLLLLLYITLNVLVSGVLDWSRGVLIQQPLPRPFDRWHADSGLVLVVYLAVHVWRRRKRLRRSTIR